VEENDMGTSIKVLASIICGLGLHLGIFALGSPSLAANFSDGDYAAALKTFVNDQGMVNYRRLKANPQQLTLCDRATRSSGLPRLGEKEKIAFWINTRLN
jgi:hypothetical protein